MSACCLHVEEALRPASHNNIQTNKQWQLDYHNPAKRQRTTHLSGHNDEAPRKRPRGQIDTRGITEQAGVNSDFASLESLLNGNG